MECFSVALAMFWSTRAARAIMLKDQVATIPSRQGKSVMGVSA